METVYLVNGRNLFKKLHDATIVRPEGVQPTQITLADCVNCTIDGVVFNDYDLGTYGSNEAVILIEDSPNTTISNIVIDNVNPSPPTRSNEYKYIYAKRSPGLLIDRCQLRNKHNGSAAIAINSGENVPDDTTIRRSYFYNIRPLRQSEDGNGYEAIRLSDSKRSQEGSRSLITECVFESCGSAGEPEVISIKRRKVTVTGCALYGCTGLITVRHGGECLIENNYVDGHNVAGSGGIRVFGDGNVICGNYITNTNGDPRFRQAIVVGNGQVNPALNGYWVASDTVLNSNTLVNNKFGISIGEDGDDSSLTVSPSGVQQIDGKSPYETGEMEPLTVNTLMAEQSTVVVDFEMSQDAICRNAPVELTNKTTTADGTIDAYSWQVSINGDKFVEFDTLEHSFYSPTENGTHDIKLIATSRDGFTGEAVQRLTVANVFARIEPSTAVATIGESIILSGAASTGDSCEPNSYTWYSMDDNGSTQEIGTETDYAFTPDAAGIYQFMLNVSCSACDCHSQAFITITVEEEIITGKRDISHMLEPNGDLIIYDNELRPGWHDWSWSTHDPKYSENYHSAPHSIWADLDGWSAYAAYFLDGQDADMPDESFQGCPTATFDRLEFYVHRGDSKGGQQITVRIGDSEPGKEWGNTVYVDVPTDDEWYLVSIPLIELDAQNIDISRIQIAGDGSSVEAILIDDIVLKAAAEPDKKEPPARVENTANVQWLHKDFRASKLGSSFKAQIKRQSLIRSSGIYGIAVRMSYYGGIVFRPLDSTDAEPNPFRFRNETVLRFLVSSGMQAPGQKYVIYGIGANGESEKHDLSLFVGSGTIGTEWQVATVPISNLLVDSTLYGVTIQENSGTQTHTGWLYLDEIRFEKNNKHTVEAPKPQPPVRGPKLVVNANNITGDISPDIYGMNFAEETLAEELSLPVNRWGGDGTTRYNYLFDTKNHSHNWYFENIPVDVPTPGQLPDRSSMIQFIDQNYRTGSDTIITLPMIGWTPKSREYAWGFSVTKYGTQQSVDPWRKDAGNGIKPDGTFITGNDPTDTSIAVDESFSADMLRYLVSKYGTAKNGGVRFANLDNEPMLWWRTHRDVHPIGTSYDELLEKTIRHAAAYKVVDSDLQLLGPVSWGWSAYFWSAKDEQDGGDVWWDTRPDRKSHGDVPFVEWYLQRLYEYEQNNGVRLLDYLDVHWYPTGSAEGVRVFNPDAGNKDLQALRLRSVKDLFDSTYTNEGYIDEPVRLIPRMREWVSANYPGTRLAITEYNYGALNHINGALAQADVLGIFGREGLDLATLWDAPKSSEPGAFAFRMYRNYDGNGSQFGDVAISAETSDFDTVSIYAAKRSTDDTLMIMLVNKSQNAQSCEVEVEGVGADVAEAWVYSGADTTRIQRVDDLNITNGTINVELAPLSIVLLAN